MKNVVCKIIVASSVMLTYVGITHSEITIVENNSRCELGNRLCINIDCTTGDVICEGTTYKSYKGVGLPIYECVSTNHFRCLFDDLEGDPNGTQDCIEWTHYTLPNCSGFSSCTEIETVDNFCNDSDSLVGG